MRTLILSFLSAAFLVASFPPFDIGFLAYFAFVPFLLALEKRNLKAHIRFSTLTGFLFFLGLLHWIHHVTWPGTILLVFYLSFYFTLFGIGVWCLNRRGVLIALPSLWVLLEFLRSHLFTGFGWGLLGYSQWQFLPLVQFADLTGIYGVSFFVMFVNVIVYQLLRKGEGRRTTPVFYLLLLSLLFSAAWGYGKIRFLQSTPKSFRATVIQGNIPQDLKWDPSMQDLVMQKYEGLTRAASGQDSDVIFWPETAVPGFLPDEQELFDRLATLNRETKSYLLVGAPWNEKGETYNSALFLKDGEVLQRYDKLHLVPYGEFIPFEKQLPILRDWIVTGNFVPGKEATIFEHPKGTFSVLVCFEDIFPGLVRRFAKGSDFLVNITNDAWFGRSGAPFQHAQASVFRAIENRRSVLRVTNTGYSCLIDPLGRIIQELKVRQETLFVTGSRTWEVPLSKKETFYTRHGDLFVGLCAMVTLLTLPLSFITRLRNRK